jgi:excisionase family DNA binding protein
MATEELMDVTEAAKFLGISPGTLYHWVSQRRIPVVHFSMRCIRFRRSDIEKWIATRVIQPGGDGTTK